MANITIYPYGTGGSGTTTPAWLVPIVTVPDTDDNGSIICTLDPNTFYVFPDPLSSLSITLENGVNGMLETYSGKFTAASSGCTLTLPSTVKLSEDAPTIEADKSYEFNIANNVIVLIKI